MRSIDDLVEAGARNALDELATMAPDRDLWAYPVWLRSRYDLLWGSPDDALRALRASRAAGVSAFGPQGVQSPLLTAAEADILMSWAHGSRADSVLVDRRRYHPLTALARARLALQSGELRQASLTARRVAAEQGSWNRTRLEAQLVWAASETLAGGADARRLWSGSLQTMYRLGMAAGPFAFLGSDTMRTAIELVPDLARVEELRTAAGIREVFAAQLSVVRLTERELELIALMHSGLTLEQAAKNMFVTLNTIKSQVRTLYRKLGVSSRAEAVVVALEHGLVG
jgi:LuxR family maltose regulon positive regulatory protein